MLDKKLPRSVLIEQILRERLGRSGRVDERFMSEPRLCREFGVSRTLIRSVLDRLVANGLLRRDGRRGTFVCRAPASEPALELFDVIQRLSAYDPHWRIEVRSITVAQGFLEIRQRLDLPEADDLVLIERVTSMETGRLSYTRSYVPFAYAASFTRSDLEASPVSQLIAQRSSVRIAKVDEYLEPELADVSSADMLEVPLGSALLAVERLYRDSDGRPVFLSRAVFRKARYRFIHRIAADSAPG